MAEPTPGQYTNEDPVLYLFTSLTSGSSHIVTATSRMETILKANRIPFKAVDIATDDKARSLWGRRAGKDESGRQRKIPGLFQDEFVVGDLVEVEDWNEYGELKLHVKVVPIAGQTMPPIAPGFRAPGQGAAAAAPVAQEVKKTVPPSTAKAVESSKPAVTPNALAMSQLGAEAAQKAKDNKKKGMEKSYSGVGEAAPVEDSLAKLSISTPQQHAVDSVAALQSPNSTAWRDPAIATISQPSIEALESLQSPRSTAWKPAFGGEPVAKHRGSEVSVASQEEIKKVEDAQKIEEEKEEEEDDDKDEEEEEEEGEEEGEEEEEEKEEDRGETKGKGEEAVED